MEYEYPAWSVGLIIWIVFLASAGLSILFFDGSIDWALRIMMVFATITGIIFLILDVIERRRK